MNSESSAFMFMPRVFGPTLVAATLALAWGLCPATAAAQVPGPPPIPKDKQPPPGGKQGPPPGGKQDTPPKSDQPPAPKPEPKPEPKGPSKEAKARVAQADKEAKAMAKYGDWLGVADTLEQAYLVLADPVLAFRIGEAAQKAHDCARAQEYLERFLEVADLGQPESKIQSARKSLSELRDFECPRRSAEDEAAHAETFARQAKKLADEDDWLGAALSYAKAYELAPGRSELAFEVGEAAWKAHECHDAVSYFYHFRDVADPRKHRGQLRQAGKYIDDSEAGKCEPWKDELRGERARELYAQGQNLEFALDYLAAAGKYERAYELLPENTVLSFRVAEAYWTAHRCAAAEPHYRTFIAEATDSRFDSDRRKAENLVARIEAHGCPEALWKTSTVGAKSGKGGDGAASSGDGQGGGSAGGGEGPPPIADNTSTVACSVGEPGGLGGLAAFFGLLVLVGRRRSSREP
jgi:uncharacterized membrane protein YgcG